LGITLTIIGTGFFKPNISSMVGELYKSGDSRRDAGFGLFYGINIGALLEELFVCT
jgi:POT family proton-dependent oligopeptide transporter